MNTNCVLENIILRSFANLILTVEIPCAVQMWRYIFVCERERLILASSQRAGWRCWRRSSAIFNFLLFASDWGCLQCVWEQNRPRFNHLNCRYSHITFAVAEVKHKPFVCHWIKRALRTRPLNLDDGGRSTQNLVSNCGLVYVLEWEGFV